MGLAMSSAKKRMYPLYYYSRLKESDRDWIMGKLKFIPEDLVHDVCIQYESIFLGSDNPRKDANTYLHSEAKKHWEKRQCKN